MSRESHSSKSFDLFCWKPCKLYDANLPVVKHIVFIIRMMPVLGLVQHLTANNRNIL